ncbi:hypothetical protein [Fusobacterium animalis]|uniref:hypothetical protein n=1 Tax=Fusobacterium animalis TaxID=76859 RepID=UPI0030CC7F2E
MKKLYVFYLFIILSLATFAQQLNTDGEAHFDKLVGVKFIKPYYPNGVNYDFLLNYTITKKGNDYYLTGKWENPGSAEIENVKTKLKVYKKIFLKSEDGDIFAYDIKKNTLALMGAEVAPPAGVDPEFEVFIYFRKSLKK